MRNWLLGGLAGAIASVALVIGTSVPATAAQTSSQTIRGGGSDTTYYAMLQLDALYSGSAGCEVQQGGVVKFDGTCFPDVATTITTENYFHDVIAEYYPIGSGGGITQLANKGNPGFRALDFARSSSAPSASTPAGLKFVAYARDGISWWTANVNTHVPGDNDLTQNEIKGIWNTCAITQWGQVNGNAGDTTPILMYTAQNNSGTRKTFDGFLGSGANSTNCIPASQKDGNFGNGERVIFENDAQPIYDQSEQGSAIFPYSFGRFQQNGGQNGSLGKVDGVAPTKTTIGNGTFPYSRYLFNVIRTTSPAATSWTKKYVGEKNGWLCKPASAHSVDPLTGDNYRTEIEDTLDAEGFVPLPLGPIGGGVTGSSHCRVITFP